MSPVAVAEVVTTKVVTTKEELEELRRKLEEQRRQGQSAAPPEGAPAEGRLTSWSDDVNGLVQFLQDLKEIMRFLIRDRLPKTPRELFEQCSPTVETQMDIAIAELKQIDSENHEIYIKLRDADLTGNPLKLKLREFWRRIRTSPVSAVLKTADRILGSLFPILATLEPVKEFKETLEERLENDGDAGLQSLNITGREQWWRQAE